MELEQVFQVRTEINARNAKELWETLNARLASPEYSPHGLFRRFRVEYAAPCASLLDPVSPYASLLDPASPHAFLRNSSLFASGEHPEKESGPSDTDAGAGDRLPPCSLGLRGLAPYSLGLRGLAPCSLGLRGLAPSLRGDDLLCPSHDFLKKLEEKTGIRPDSASALLAAISQCLDTLDSAGCRFADHALDHGFHYEGPDKDTDLRILRLWQGAFLTPGEQTHLASDLLRMLGAEYARRHWVLQLHIGAQRFTSTRLRAVAGPAGGFAAMGNGVDLLSLVRLLDDLDQGPYGLPRTILYTLNPADNALFATLSGSFPGVTQGPAWWWCDHLWGIRNMLETFAAHSVLSTFVGMTSDSRSLLSLSRHDYFRRILCGWIGEKAAQGQLPDSYELLENLVEAVCYGNARDMICG